MGEASTHLKRLLYICAKTGHLPTDPLVRQMTELQAEAMEYALLKVEDNDWKRLERILGTYWEYDDVAPATVNEDGKVEKRPADHSKMRVPLALFLQPNFMKVLKQNLRPSEEKIAQLSEKAKKEREAAGVVDMADATSKNEFIRQFREMLSGASQAVREMDDQDGTANERLAPTE